MMAGIDLWLTLAASGVLLLAHIVRAGRWALLFPSTYLTRRFNLLLGLGLGYAVDLVLPLRIGELLRVLLVHRRDRIRFSHVAATVFVERMTDLVAVSLILAALLLLGGEWDPLSWAAPILMATTAVAIIGAAALVRRSTRARREIWRGASVFNDRLRAQVADFCWSAAEIIASPTLLRWRYIGGSMVMWALYLSAYNLFGRAAGIASGSVMHTMLSRPFNALLQTMSRGNSAKITLLLVAFAVLPIAAIVLYGALRDHRMLMSAWDTVRKRGRSGVAAPLAARRRFEAANTYDYFLASLFSGSNQLVSGFGLEGVDDCIIHKFFHGGSDAITALVEVDQRLLIRKFAVGAAGRKLKGQADWLRQRGNGELPLVAVVGEREIRSTYTYDMPLVTPSNDFYDVIHTSPPAHGSQLLKRVVEQLVEFHALTETTVKDDRPIVEYLDTKATKNARTILDFARSVVSGPNFTLNGSVYEFSSWDRLLDPAWLRSQIRDRRVASVHGDLTIENIIIAPNYPLGFYIIDPNPENVFDSPLIDWAKLMQSLHLGYETLNQGISCDVSHDVVRLSHVRSQSYAELHQHLEAEARERLGGDALREIYFHEIINYLRLTTYKIRQSPMRGFGFFACTAILLDRYTKRWC